VVTEETVTDEASNIPSPFDLRTIKHLIVLMSRHDLSEIDLQEGDLRIRLRRGPRGVAVQALPTTPMPVVGSATPTAAAAPPPQADKPAKPLLTIKSPTPGTFYSASKPESPPFVTVGSRVTSETVVCIIEAMKLFNEIQAECSGVITEICVENQQPVEWGQVLFKVDPSG
jgi:acetyl-CoA carboxylase biotin carboxyl carrier protein